MSSNLRDPKAAAPDRERQPGLDPDELRAEQADELPDRDALSIIGVGGLEDGLPPAGLLDGFLDGNATDRVLPLDGLPVERYPADQLPIQLEPPPIADAPLDPPVDTRPVDPPADGAPAGIPDPLDASAGADVEI